MAGALINAGQDCTAATRAYVQRPLYEAFVEQVASLMDGVRLGPVDDPATDMGSLISFRQRDKVAGMVEDARRAGATVVRGGKSPDGPYGLAASAWTTNVYRAGRASREIQAGCVWINDHVPIISEMSHGGYKASGFGKDMSAYSFDEYTDVRHVMSDITGDRHKSWHDVVFTSP